MVKPRDTLRSLKDLQSDTEKEKSEEKKTGEAGSGFGSLASLGGLLRKELGISSDSAEEDVAEVAEPPQETAAPSVTEPPPKEEKTQRPATPFPRTTPPPPPTLKGIPAAKEKAPEPRIASKPPEKPPSPATRAEKPITKSEKPTTRAASPSKAAKIDFSELSSVELYKHAHKVMASIAKQIKRDIPVVIDELFPLSREIVAQNREKDGLFIRAIDKKRLAPWFISHSVNIAIIASKIGYGLKLNDEKLVDLCVAGFLHDVGMLKVPDAILYKNGKLSEAEYNVIKQHPINGRKILQHLEKKYPWLVQTVYEEQEREDGSGYPRGIEGDQISLFAKVVGIADIFEAKVHGRSYRQAMNSHIAIQEIIRFKGKQYSLNILKAFIDVITIYPVGSYIRLNTGEIARVVKVNRQRPIRPDVVVLKDAQGNKYPEPRIIELEKEPLIYIKEPVTEF